MTERELAKAAASAVNCFGFKEQEFCKQMSEEHRTLQQSFTRLCLAWIRACADYEDWQIDGRNEASVHVCRILAGALDEEGIRSLPLV